MDYFPTASDMQRRTQDLCKKRENTMQHVLRMCIKQIIKCADMEQTECAFEVPEVVLGLPTYDIGAAVAYVQDHLRAKGFQIVYIFPRVLIISWRKKEAVPTTSSTRKPLVPQLMPSLMPSLPPPAPAPAPADVEGCLGPPRPMSTSTVRPIEIEVAPKQHATTTPPPFVKPHVRPIAELKPSGRFTLNLS